MSSEGSKATTQVRDNQPDFRLTLAARTVLHRVKQIAVSSEGTERIVVTFNATRPGNYRFRGTVTVNGISKQSTAGLRVIA